MNHNFNAIVRRSILFLLFLWYICSCSYAQVTTRNTISKAQNISVVMSITAGDTTFTLMGQNAAYRHIIDILIIKSGSAEDIYDLLSQCLKFIPEQKGTSMSYGENNLLSFGNGQMSIWRDRGSVTLRKNIIIKFQADLLTYIQ